ncbi:MBL fold metallo-hydrolase [Ruania halotolerans]|uniref:MBL fold metallo-hydrolase n=1 Tax=Ruania halotolerans TaxID=2897773 RepID=UPI001E3B7255|nr:MBL fold metallo-hydrolase [Ruania halotolerans]UFU07041.1 MBL fold metallo-hydrolase [Ruania halotolerans]
MQVHSLNRPRTPGAQDGPERSRATEESGGPAGRWAPASLWFDVRDLGNGIYLVAEPGHVNSYLVLGRKRALLVDSGMGIAPISEVIAALTSLPVLVLATHSHTDHRGGHADLAAAHRTGRIEVAGFAAHPASVFPDADPTFLTRYARVMREVVAEHHTLRELDDQSFFALTDLPRMRDLPDLTGWSVPGVPITERVADGQLIDLGGRTIQVMHTPGHAPDAVTLWEPATASLLTGDTILSAAHWLQGDDADLAAFADSTARLAALGARRALVAHNLRAELPGSHVARVAEAAALVRDGGTRPRPARDLLGGPAWRHETDGIVVLTAPAARRGER